MGGSFDVAWAAGLFDGEASVIKKGRRATVTLKMCDLETVQRFQRVVRFGSVYGPYKNRTGERDGYPRSDFYTWACPVVDAPAVVEMLWPWLSPTRRARLGLSPYAVKTV